VRHTKLTADVGRLVQDSLDKVKVQYTKKSGKYDEFKCIRKDGSIHAVMMPKIGSLPHDLVHFVVEKELKMENGLYAHVEKKLIDGYYLKLETAKNAEQSAIDTKYAESLVECFQAEFNSGNQTPQYLQEILNVTCSARHISHFEITPQQIEKIRTSLDEMNQIWSKIKIGQMLELEF
jgi:hypothetical protein